MIKRYSSAFRQSRPSIIVSLGRTALGAFLLTAGITATLPITAAHAQESVFEGRDKWLFPGWEKVDGVDKAAVDGVLDLISFTNKVLAEKKTSLVVTVVPAKAIVHQDKLPADRSLSSDVLGLYDDIQKGLAARDVTSADILPAMKTLPTDQQAFFRSDFHWTAWASEAAAANVAELIKSKWQLAGKAGDGAKLGDWTKERRFGDLAANFMTPAQRNAVGREVFTVRGEATKAKGGLIDDATAPVHVVGNSFTAPYLGFSQALSHALDRRVTLTWNPGDVGPWATLLQYLQSDDFKQNPPQVLVWQFNEGQMQKGPAAQGQWTSASIIAVDEWKNRIETAVKR
ncbi:twin-arginine translocation pathway signal [Brucella sp. BE17]|uniref:alginate O-acetyltransferase AlgX-related protein n=1 Tax=Brucella sp. BE17 TaxID=3142977 RepID=UPI0031BA452F